MNSRNLARALRRTAFRKLPHRYRVSRMVARSMTQRTRSPKLRKPTLRCTLDVSDNGR